MTRLEMPVKCQGTPVIGASHSWHQEASNPPGSRPYLRSYPNLRSSSDFMFCQEDPQTPHAGVVRSSTPLMQYGEAGRLRKCVREDDEAGDELFG